jgi:rhodanese-related sulfurtransferase/Flp pilus assembly protein TadD
MRFYLAEAMRKPTSLAYAVSADVLTQEGRFEEAWTAINQAVALAPNDSEIYVSNARILNATGHAAEAEIAVRKAQRLDPRFSPASLRVLAISLFHQEKYKEAFETLQRVVSQQSDVVEDYATLISCLGHLGRSDGVKAAIDKYNEIAVPAGNDRLTVQEMGWWWYGNTFSYDDTYRARLQEGLRKAGVPEGPGTDLRLGDYKPLIVERDGLFRVTGASEIDATEAKALHGRGDVIFIDVRAATDFVRGHIPQAKNLSLAERLSRETLAQAAGKNDDVVFSCMGKYCPYSAYASAKALLCGYTHVHRFAGGFPAWKDAGYPVEVSTPPRQ